MSAIHAQVVKDLEWNSINMKKYFDNKREDAPSLKEGDRVYLRRTKNATDFNIKTRNDMDKLNCLLLGPYEIKRKLENDNYELWLPENMRIHPIFHISLLKPTENAVNKDNNPDIYEVDAIIGKKVSGGRKLYEVKWKGYDQTTWEPLRNLNCHQLVERYAKQISKEQRQRKGKTHSMAEAATYEGRASRSSRNS